MPAALRSGGPANLCQVIDNHADIIDSSLIDVSFPQNGALRLITNDGTIITKFNQPKFANTVTIGLQITKDNAPNANRINWNTGEYQINAQTRTVTFGSLNLSSGDLVNPRIDTIIANLSLPFPNGQITVLTGVPDPNPVPAITNPLTELVLAYVLVDPGATATTGGYTLIPFNTSQTLPLPPGSATGQTLIWNNNTQSWNAGNISGTLPNGNTLFQTIRWDGTNWVPYNRVTMGAGLEDFLINGMTFRFIGLVSGSPGAGRFDVQSFGTTFNTTGITTLNSTTDIFANSDRLFTTQQTNFRLQALGTNTSSSVSAAHRLLLSGGNTLELSSPFLRKLGGATGQTTTYINSGGTDTANQLDTINNTRTFVVNTQSTGSTSTIDANNNLAVINHTGTNLTITNNNNSVLINTQGNYNFLDNATIQGGSRGELHTVVITANNNFTFSNNTRRCIILPNNDSQVVTLPAASSVYEGRICQITVATPFQVELNGNGQTIEGFSSINIGLISTSASNDRIQLSDIEVQYINGQWRVIDRNSETRRRKLNGYYVWAPAQPALPTVFEFALTTLVANSTSPVTINLANINNRFPNSAVAVIKNQNTGLLTVDLNLIIDIDGNPTNLTLGTGDIIYLQKITGNNWTNITPASGTLSSGTIPGQTLTWNGSAWVNSNTLVNGMEISAIPSLSTDFSGILVDTAASSEYRGFLKTYSGNTDIFGGVLVNDTPSAFTVGLQVENQMTAEQHLFTITESNITTLSQDGFGFKTDLVITPGQVYTETQDDNLLSYNTQVLPTGFYTGGRINRASHEKTFGIYTLRNVTTIITTAATFVILNTNPTPPITGRGVAQISPAQFVITNLADHTVEITLTGQVFDTGGPTEFEFQLWVNGNPTTQSYIVEVTNTPSSVTFTYFANVTDGDIVEIYVANNDNANDITFYDGSLSIKEL
jgi:hypothetical protein